MTYLVDIPRLDTVLQEEGASHRVVDDGVADGDVVGTVDVDGSVEGLMD